jgi:uncharacterized paraquat-inducible protein A
MGLTSGSLRVEIVLAHQDMRLIRIATIWAVSVLHCAAITAQDRQQEDAATGSMLFSLLWSLAPYAILVVVLWPLVRLIRKNQRRSEEYMAATTKHHEKVERLLERIALGLSSNDQSQSPSEQATCVECGGIFSVTDMIKHEDRFVCARCKPILLQKLTEGAKVGTPKT